MTPEVFHRRIAGAARELLGRPLSRESLGFNGFLALILLPALAALLFTAYTAYERERSAAHQSLLTRVRNVSQLLDAQFLRVLGSMEMIAATSDELHRRELAAFHGRMVLARQQLAAVSSLSLSTPDGQVVLSTLRPYGASLPPTVSPERFKAVLDSGRAQISSVMKSRLTGEYVVRVDVPVTRQGRIDYILSANLPCKSLSELLSGQALPEGWAAVVYDRDGVIAARTLNQSKYIGLKVAPTLLQWLDGPAETVGEGKTLEGLPSVAAMHRSTLTGYSVTGSVPEATLTRPLRIAALINIAAGGGGLLLGAFIAWRFVQSMRRSIVLLERATEAVADGAGGIDLPESQSKELNRLFRRFKQMFAALQASQRASEESRRQLEFAATHDPLTGLANRVLVRQRMEQAIAAGMRSGDLSALLLLDLDHFKVVNDTLTHSAGDALLVEMTARVEAQVRAGDTVARLGGDEFLILLHGIDGPDLAAGIAEKLLAAVAQPSLVTGREICVTASIGITLAPLDGAGTDELIRNADIAMYRAKEEGRSMYRFYSSEMQARIQERGKIEAELRQAIRRRELVLYFQPRCDLQTGRIVSAEALIRWNHPQRGFLPPAEFIPIAEETGLIVPIGEWVMETACRIARGWERAGFADIAVSVNVSAQQFHASDLPQRVAHHLAASALRPALLELELTESDAMRDPETALSMLQQIKALGVKISLDDFGTGYSSLSYLKRFPIDCLKIDRSFISDITFDADDLAIARTVIALGATLGHTVLAEGVETHEQLELLRTLGCSQVQGYLFSKPVPAADFEALLAAQDREQAQERAPARREASGR